MGVLAVLDPSSRKPLYQQLREALEQSIAAGHFPDGKLPSSRQLAIDLGISRNTVNLAYQELVAEGFVTSNPRSGLVVNGEIQDLLHNDEVRGAAGGPNWPTRLTHSLPHPVHELATPADWYNYAYPLIGGQIDCSEFPVKDWLGVLREALETEHRVHSVQDARFYDDPLLVHRLRSDVLPSRGITADPEQILITTGSQQGLHLVAAALARHGTRVAVENPGYIDAPIVFRAAGAEILPIPVDGSGLTMTGVLNGAELIFVSPSHQMPTCVTLSAARRRRLLELANAIDAIIVEDDYDSELRYVGRPTPSLKALDEHERVVYLGSFSKVLAPGLRLGYVVGAPELIAHMREWRRVMVRHPSGLLQRALALWLSSGGYQRWLRRNRNNLKRKWERMAEAMHHLPWEVDIPTGGTGIWVNGPSNLDSRVLAAKARRNGVLIDQGQPFYAREPRPVNSFRLGFMAIDIDRIEPGVETLARCIRELPSRMK